MKTFSQCFAFTTVTLALFSCFNSYFNSTVQAALPDRIALNYTPPPPPNRGAPGNRGEGASRGCTINNQPLMALVPSTEQTVDTATLTQVWGLTSVDHPSFWFHLPYDPTKLSSIEFVLQTEQDQTIYRTTVPLPATAGIMQVQLPSTINPLEPDQRYHWFFKVRASCQPNQAPMLSYVEGWVQRTRLDPALDRQIAEAAPLQKATLYAENGIWYDALTTLAELKLAAPEDQAIAQDWTNLLKAIGLENLATQPLIR
jgi:hypothetical protein